MSHRLIVALAVLVFATACTSPGQEEASDDPDRYEIWVIDQSDTVEDGGGTIHIYEGAAVAADPAGAAAGAVDLGTAARDLCLEQTQSAPKRPHMILFNADQTHAVVSFVATGHVLFLDAATREPVTCIDAGEQAHAAFPSADQSYVVVANQNGKLLQRITSDFTSGTFTLDDEATIDLAACTTPGGAPCEHPDLRPDTAPICPVIDDDSRLAFVTLRGGGLLVVDATATPMAIVAEYDREHVRPNGCGGVQADGTMYLNSGGGTPAHPFGSNLYAFAVADFSGTQASPNVPAPSQVFSRDDRGSVDSHGSVLTGNGRYVWVADRAANLIVVVDTRTDTMLGDIALAGDISDDPAPDLLDISPDGDHVFVSLRGPTPLTANVADVDNAVGSTPGVGVIRVDQDGASGTLEAVIPISRVVDGAEQADPHGLRVRRTG